MDCDSSLSLSSTESAGTGHKSTVDLLVLGFGDLVDFALFCNFEGFT
jgi:hypothetical protein